jgi:hypothetical protein
MRFHYLFECVSQHRGVLGFSKYLYPLESNYREEVSASFNIDPAISHFSALLGFDPVVKLYTLPRWVGWVEERNPTAA